MFCNHVLSGLYIWLSFFGGNFVWEVKDSKVDFKNDHQVISKSKNEECMKWPEREPTILAVLKNIYEIFKDEERREL
jgi:hypothetical protein